MHDSPNIIVGGGIAGLAAGLGLARAHLPSRILERAASFETVGAGLQLGPNAVRALQFLGAWDAVEPCCSSPEEIHIRDGISGKILHRVRLGKVFEQRFGAPYRVAHRADLQMALLNCAAQSPHIELQTNAEVTGVFAAEGTIQSKSGETFHAPRIIAADGIKSIIRAKLFPAHIAANSGHTLFRALLPTSLVPQAIETSVVTLWLCPRAHVVHYAVSGGKSFNIVATLEGSEQFPALALRDMSASLQELVQLPQSWLQWPGHDLPPRKDWSLHQTVLIGDAAHASLPYLAQGAAMALEDACTLSNILAQNRPLQTLSELRFRRTARLQARSRKLGRIYHAAGAFRLARNAVLQWLPEQRFLDELAWIYEWTPASS